MRNILVLVAFCMIAAMAMPAFAAKPDAPADGLVLNHGKQQKGVVFNHSTHTKADCVACHHPVAGVEDYRSCVTEGCHAVDKADVVTPADGSPAPVLYYNAIHNKNTKGPDASCISCHTKYAAANPDSKKEMTGCKASKCHP